MTNGSARENALHATVVLIGEVGVLIRGDSGAGKSRLAQAVIADTQRRGGFARLVGDDRVMVSATHGVLVARPHPAIAGLIEERGSGLLRVDYEPAARLACVVDIVSAANGPARLPHPEETEIVGVRLPKMALRSSVGPDEGARRLWRFLNP